MINVIILAAGKGTRMKSKIPKPLHKVCNKTLLDYSVDLAKKLENISLYIVASHALQNVCKSESKCTIPQESELLKYIFQEEQLGTGHAVQLASSYLNKENEKTLIMYADTPFVSFNTLQKMILSLDMNDLSIACFHCKDLESKYGRIIWQEKMMDSKILEVPFSRMMPLSQNSLGNLSRVKIHKIIEYKDATEAERKITLCNAGIMAIKTSVLLDNISKLEPSNSVNELYLTDLVEIVNKNDGICGYVDCEESEVMGINSRYELEIAENTMQNKLRSLHLDNGVTFLNKNSAYLSSGTKIEYDVQIGENVRFIGDVLISSGVIIDGNCVIENCKIGNNVRIESFCNIKDSIIASNSNVLSFSDINNAKIGENCKIGPFARVRPETELQNNVKIGNFVEIKKSNIASNAKINHLSYIGDALVGQNTNIGAGTITCNYDGFEKHQTIIGDDVFIGSQACILAPVKIGNSTLIAAGSVISKDVSEGDVAISRSEQKNIANAAIRYRNKKSVKKDNS